MTDACTFVIDTGEPMLCGCNEDDEIHTLDGDRSHHPYTLWTTAHLARAVAWLADLVDVDTPYRRMPEVIKDMISWAVLADQ